MVADQLSPMGRTTPSGNSCSLPSLNGGGKIEYSPKPKPQRSRPRANEPLAFLPGHRDRQDRVGKDDSRYVTRSVPVDYARHKTNGDRGSNSAPMEISRHHTNHERQPDRSHLPRLPKINNLLNEPVKQMVHGTSTATEAGRKDGKRWASSWAEARATTTTRGGPRERSKTFPHSTHDSNHASRVGHSREVTSNSISSSPRTTASESVKSSKELEGNGSSSRTEPRRTGAGDSKVKPSPAPSIQISASRDSKIKDDRRTKFVSEIDAGTNKTLKSDNKSSTVLNTTRTGVTRQTSEHAAANSLSTPQKEAPQSRADATSRGSQSTGMSLRRGKAKPAAKRRSHKPVLVTRKSLVKQKTLQSVYGNTSFKVQRQVRVLEKMEKVQRKEVEEYNRDLKVKEQSRMESILRQRMALKRVRDRFDEEQVRRFRQQYVSWKSVEEDRLKHSSETYGLPDFIYEDRYERTLKKIPEGQAAPASTRKAPKKFKKYASWVKNIRVFEKLLNPKVGGNMAEALETKQKAIVEGIDTVKLESNDSTRAKKVNVKRLIGSAKKLLSVTDNMDDISEVSSYRDDSDSDSDSSLNFSDTEEDR